MKYEFIFVIVSSFYVCGSFMLDTFWLSALNWRPNGLYKFKFTKFEILICENNTNYKADNNVFS